MAAWTKFHSAVRWGKEIKELETHVAADKTVVTTHDDKNGNQALHIAAQNGHIEITNADGLIRTACECYATVKAKYAGLLSCQPVGD